jgi:tRNA-specific adenosine deaminase 1
MPENKSAKRLDEGLADLIKTGFKKLASIPNKLEGMLTQAQTRVKEILRQKGEDILNLISPESTHLIKTIANDIMKLSPTLIDHQIKENKITLTVDELIQLGVSEEKIESLRTSLFEDVSTIITNAYIESAEEVTNETVAPNLKQVITRLVKKSSKMFVFGFIDNFIMVLVGDLIDASLASTLGLSTMAAAGLGNALSDAVGEAGSDKIDGLLGKIGLDTATISDESMKQANWFWRLLDRYSSILGVLLGCLAGMVPLLFTQKHTKKKIMPENKFPTNPFNKNQIVRPDLKFQMRLSGEYKSRVSDITLDYQFDTRAWMYSITIPEIGIYYTSGEQRLKKDAITDILVIINNHLVESFVERWGETQPHETVDEAYKRYHKRNYTVKESNSVKENDMKESQNITVRVSDGETKKEIWTGSLDQFLKDNEDVSSPVLSPTEIEDLKGGKVINFGGGAAPWITLQKVTESTRKRMPENKSAKKPRPLKESNDVDKSLHKVITTLLNENKDISAYDMAIKLIVSLNNNFNIELKDRNYIHNYDKMESKTLKEKSNWRSSRKNPDNKGEVVVEAGDSYTAYVTVHCYSDQEADNVVALVKERIPYFTKMHPRWRDVEGTSMVLEFDMNEGDLSDSELVDAILYLLDESDINLLWEGSKKGGKLIKEKTFSQDEIKAIGKKITSEWADHGFVPEEILEWMELDPSIDNPERLAEMIDHVEYDAVKTYIDEIGWIGEGEFEEAYQGHFEDMKAFALDQHERGLLDSAWLSNYIDWEWVGKELQHDYFEENGYVFRNM